MCKSITKCGNEATIPHTLHSARSHGGQIMRTHIIANIMCKSQVAACASECVFKCLCRQLCDDTPVRHCHRRRVLCVLFIRHYTYLRQYDDDSVCVLQPFAPENECVLTASPDRDVCVTISLKLGNAFLMTHFTEEISAKYMIC